MRVGETFIYGLTQENAQAVVEACARLGVDRHRVHTTDNGIIVPNEVADEIERAAIPQWSPAGATF